MPCRPSLTRTSLLLLTTALFAHASLAQPKPALVRNVDRPEMQPVAASCDGFANAACTLFTVPVAGRLQGPLPWACRRTVQYLGAGHGFAGNVYPLHKGASLLDAGRRATLYERCVATLAAAAKSEDGAVNWPPGTFAPRPDGPRMLMQWCHGAPGIESAGLMSLASTPLTGTNPAPPPPP